MYSGKWIVIPALILTLSAQAFAEDPAASYEAETLEERDARMGWWREARFGMFIHWGLYAVPAGEWNGKTHYAEWIRNKAEIPGETYDPFVGQFNPDHFDADAWVLMAKRAGMKYIVITSKHHDGFGLWPSDQTDYDIGSTPFQRDILGELSAACKKHGVRMCFYHSIMDWHHPDYLPRRKWETDRTTEGADYERYVTYMKAQLKELVERYDPAVLWFDGEWEDTWTHEHGKELYDYVRGLKPDILINNRVDKGRRGMHGMNKEGEWRGDFGTPEQKIPATGMPGVDWESCMTMNGHWGWNKHDKNWKSDTDLIRKLVDIASKGGNFLLNIGPKADGTFPAEAISRLDSIGQWMDVHADSICGTGASPFGNLDWGRCTVRDLGNGKTRLYLHVFDWPDDGAVVLPLRNPVKTATLMGSGTAVIVEARDDGTRLVLPDVATNPHASVVVCDVEGALDIGKARIEGSSAQ